MNPPSPSTFADFGRLSWPGKFCVAALLAGAAALSVLLWPDWRSNPDLSHGFFMPVIFLLLLHESRQPGHSRWLGSGVAANLIVVGALLAGLTALGAAGLYAVSVGWTHALVKFALTGALVMMLAAGLVALNATGSRLMALNWSTVCGIGLWLLSAPIPPGTYTRLTLGLQLWVSQNVLRALHLLGVPAVRHGNVIELARGSVGVEEACSGVRSLISCVFAGILFSALLVRRPWARALIIVLSVPLALGMNFARSLLLTLLANDGININGTLHDATGFAVLGVTALLLGALAVWLSRGEPVAADTAPDSDKSAVPAGAARFPLAALSAGVALAVALVAFFFANTRSAGERGSPVPNLASMLPEAPAGWTATNMELFEFSGILHTDHLVQRSYSRPGPNGPVNILIYVAYWQRGQASVSMVALHTPDACWPGSGWIAQPTPQPRVALEVGNRTLADAEARVFTLGSIPQHVWFWHLYDGRPITYSDPYSARELLRIAWRYGFRREGDQFFVRVSSNRPWDEIAREPVLAQFFANTRPFGL